MARSGQVQGFLPSIFGFRFVNSFPDEPDYQVDIPKVGKVSIGNASNGLCGGMVYTVCDYFHARQLPPRLAVPPAFGTPLFTYIAARLMDSFNLPGGVTTYYYWMNTPDHDTHIGPLTRSGVASMTVNTELPKILADIDGNNPSPLNLVQVASANPADLGQNHQVLAYRYAIDDAQNLTLWVYDPNKDYANADDARLMLNLSNPTHTTPITHTLGNSGETVRGFFHGEYTAKSPAGLPRTVIGDFDGDGRTDFCVYDTQAAEWRPAINKPGSGAGGYTWQHWGGGSAIPVPADFNGDGKTDFCVYDTQTGEWRPCINNPGGDQGAVWVTLGGADWIPVPADYDGDGRADFAVYNPATGDWQFALSPDGTRLPTVQWGGPGWIPVPADYNGDGRDDICIYNPSTGEWRPLISHNAAGNASWPWTTWGGGLVMPVPGDYSGDGKADFCVYDPSTSEWMPAINNPGGSAGYPWTKWGGPTTVPVTGDFDGDGKADFCVYDLTTGEWRPAINHPGGNAGYVWADWGGPNFVPMTDCNSPAWRRAFMVPHAEFSATLSGFALALDASASHDRYQGKPTSLNWDLGDGSAATGATVRHSYTKPGTYTVVLTVSDVYGAQAQVSRQVVVTMPAPKVQPHQHHRTGARSAVAVTET